MAENMIETALMILENVVAPSISDLKAHAITTDKNFEMVRERFEGVDKQFKSVDEKFMALNERMEFQFKAMMSELHAMRAQIETSNMRQYSELRERVAVIESQLRTKQ